MTKNFALENVWSDSKLEKGGDEIFRITGYRRDGKTPAAEIDFSSSAALEHLTALRADRVEGGLKLPLGAAVFLAPFREQSCLFLDLDVPACFLGRRLRVGFASAEKRSARDPALAEGLNHLVLNVDKELTNRGFDLYLLPELVEKPSPDPASVVSDCTIVFRGVRTGSCSAASE